MTDIEIPYEKDRKGHYRFFEILPGALSWTLLFAPIILSFINIGAAVFFILAYLLIYFIRTVGYDIRAIQGYITMRHHIKLDWKALLSDLEADKITEEKADRPKWHYTNLERRRTYPVIYKPSQVVHAVIIATVNESIEVLEPTLKSLVDSDYDSKEIILVMAYEERAGQETKDRVDQLVEDYKKYFKDMFAVGHPANIPGEIIGKGGNDTYAGRKLKAYLEKRDINPETVLVTTLDADNRPHKKYFSALTYMFCIVPKPLRASYQPLAMFTNNIWDAPTMMRVIATGNNLFYIVLTQRPHLLRNFSAHAQPMQSLIDTDFWSVRTIVEDGHQFWRSYFRYDGDYRVYPISIPVYQDAVLAKTYLKTLKAQFIQLRRWTYGVSDVAFIADKGFYHKNTIPKRKVLTKLLRTMEGHVTWAAGTILIFGAAFIPAFFHPHSYAATDLPLVVSRIQQIGIIGLLASVYVCLVTLPPRPARYKRRRHLIMLWQWLFTPVVGICYGSFAAFYSQTRLMFGKYIRSFDVTEKAVVVSKGQRVSSVSDPGRTK